MELVKKQEAGGGDLGSRGKRPVPFSTYIILLLRMQDAAVEVVREHLARAREFIIMQARTDIDNLS